MIHTVSQLHFGFLSQTNQVTSKVSALFFLLQLFFLVFPCFEIQQFFLRHFNLWKSHLNWQSSQCTLCYPVSVVFPQLFAHSQSWHLYSVVPFCVLFWNYLKYFSPHWILSTCFRSENTCQYSWSGNTKCLHLHSILFFWCPALVTLFLDLLVLGG